MPNPWRTIWLSPRVTIRRILDAEERPNWIPVVALATISVVITSLQFDETGAISASRSAMPMFTSAVNMFAGVFIGSFFVAIVGSWLGGDANPADLRYALGWSHVPLAVGAVFWIPVFLTLGPQALSGTGETATGLELIGLVFILAFLVCSIWTLVIQVGCIASAQQFSLGKALLNALILWIPVFFLLPAVLS
jgi:hypothetical protein